jgi:predicted outer membrane protein
VGTEEAKEDGGMSKQHLVRGAWAVAAIMATGVAWAALPQQNASNPATGQVPTTQRSANWNQNRGQAMTGHINVDHFLLKVTRQANQDEIATARLAEQRALNPDVKKFAMQLVADHTRFMNRLQQFENGQKAAPGPRGRRFNRGASNFQTTPSTTQAQTTVPGAANQGAFNQPGTTGQRVQGQMAGTARHDAARHFVGIMDQVAEQTQKSVQRELSQKEGAQFDRCFLSWQVLDHIWLVDALTVFEQNASPALQPILQEGLQTSQQHLTHAKALLSRLEQGHTKSTAQRESRVFQQR